ncbi:MAG: hypothetical protein K5695_08090 [Oscillospiraceae bacterium]|nr:hypothetical protein [Oscillospiraceae bacterium]
MEKHLFLALTISAAVGFGYGLFRFFRKKSALYIKMIVYGIGCAMLGRLFETLQLFSNGSIHSGFHVGVLGVVGSFLFFYSSNYGQMASLVDDGSKTFRKYRLIALAAPAVVFGMYIFYFCLTGFCESTVVCGIESLVIAQSSYFHLKHVIIPDVDYGVIRSLRTYNLLALVYAFLCMAEILLTAIRLPACTVIVYVLMCIALLAFVPVLEGGVKKWTT